MNLLGVVRRRVVAAVLISFALLAATPPAHAFEPATTHAGLTEQAVLVSSLQRVLAHRLGRALGLLEPLQLHASDLDAEALRSLWARFEALDPAGGYRPGTDGSASALTWVVAGSVLSKTPPERGRNHFFNPGNGQGLKDDRGLSGFVHSMRLAIDGGASFRQVATGTAFDITGEPSPDWILSAQNDQGLPVFLNQMERAVTEPGASAREAALVQALLAMGGMMAVLEDAGDPSHVRNDFRASFLARQSASPWDRASGFERYVSQSYGRIGVPKPKAAIRRGTLREFFTASDKLGLADRTQRSFFSDGTVPAMVLVDPGTTTRDVTHEARESLTLPWPTVTRLELREPGKKHYMRLEGRRALAYERTLDRVTFFLDSAVYADSAKVLLPEIGAYAAGLVDHLLRAGLMLSATGMQVAIGLDKDVAAFNTGSLRVYAEDRSGIRRPIDPSIAVAAGTFAEGRTVTVEAPVGTVRVAAVLRGADAAGPAVAVGELALP